MRNLILIVFILLAVDVYAQKPKKERKDRSRFEMRDTFKFAVLSNEFDHEPDLSLQVNPYYFELYGININMGYDASLHFNHNKYEFWATYRGSYLELVNKNTVEETNSLGGPATAPLSLVNGEIGGEYFYKSIVEENEESLFIGNFGGFGFSRTFKANYQLKYGIRLGLQYFQTYFSGDQINFAGYYINDPEKKIIHFGLGQVGTNLQENIINIGMSSTFTHHVVLKNATLGLRETHYKTYIYGDIMVAPSMVYTNVIMKNYSDISRLPFTDFNLNTGTLKNRFGARVGFMYSGLFPFGANFGIEAGERPGPSFGQGFYGMIKFGFALNAHILNHQNRSIGVPRFGLIETH